MPDPIRYEILPLDQVHVYKSNTLEQDCIDKFGHDFGPIIFLWVNFNDTSGFDNNKELIRTAFKQFPFNSTKTRFFFRLEKILRLYAAWLKDQTWRDPLPTVPFGVGRYYAGIDRVSVMKSLDVREYNCLVIEKHFVIDENLPIINSYWKDHGGNLWIVNGVLDNRDNFETILEFKKTKQWLKSSLPIKLFCSPNLRTKTVTTIQSKGKAPKSLSL
jgi:hypothetical protein